MENLTRSQVRYYCFRIQTELASGTDAGNIPDGLKEHIESQDFFQSWEEFGETWDISEAKKGKIFTNPLDVTLRTYGIQEEWQRTIEREARELPIKTEKKKKKRKIFFKKDK